MYSNLIAEMKAKKVSRSDIQKLLQIHSNSVSNKLKHRTSFTIDEAMKIQEEFFLSASSRNCSRQTEGEKMKTEKENFVSYCLSPMLRKADNKIYSAEYDTEDSGNEFVTVTYINGCKKIVYVTGDSLITLMGDVIKKLK